MSDLQPRSTRGFAKRSTSGPRRRHSYQNGRASSNSGPSNSRPSNSGSSGLVPANSEENQDIRSEDIRPEDNRPMWLDAYVANLKKDLVSEVTKNVVAEMTTMWRSKLDDVMKWRSMYHSVKNKLSRLENENWASKSGVGARNSEAGPSRERSVADPPEKSTERNLEKENVSANGLEPVQEEITTEVQGEDMAAEDVSVPLETAEQVCRLLVALTSENFDKTLSELLELKAEELENAIKGFFVAVNEAPDSRKQYALMWKALHDKKPWDMQQKEALDAQLRAAQSDSPSSEFISTVMFIGELFNQDLVVKSSLVKLLQCLGDGKTECLCHLLKNVGKKCQEVDLDLEEYFKPFEKLLAANSEAPTVENMIRDLIKLKTNGWKTDDDGQVPEIDEKVISNGKNDDSMPTASNKE